MGKLGWVVALAAVAVRTEAAGAATVVRLDARDNGRLVVPVGLNGKGAYPFLVDTGAGTTVLGHKLAGKLGVKTVRTDRVRTFAGAVPVPVGRLDTVGIGSRWVTGVEVLCADLRRMWDLEPGIEGILGQDVLSHFNYVLDRRSRRLEIEDDGDLRAVLGGTRVPFERSLGKIYVPIADGALRLMLDSGVPYLVLYEDAASKLAITFIGAGPEAAAESRLGARALRPARLAALEIGDLRLRNLRVHVTRRAVGERVEDGFLPLALFDAIYVNNGASFLILNPRRGR
ncbi:MAG: hypothetical protein DMG07_09655 [Acidobacteria bacterium]|nr:MAG: hypothetical protein DMG07_09655 [Acidobacteriota bacterium]